ncbi:MAG: flagellar biosynthetic protein FliR, partial [Dehalococcoidia bacterium]|nr:flagellar biosynthetic protein FliR [Dehalococcoidia bacterium]
MTAIEYWPSYVTAFALVLTRAGGLVVASPIFSSRSLPAPVKVAIALALAVALFPPGSAIPPGLPRDVLPFASAALTEAIVGLVIGFAATLVFFAVQMAGQLIGIQIGLSLSQFFDPVNGAPSATMETFYSLLASAIFLTLNAHHWLILGIDRTFDLIPLGGALAAGQIAGRIVQLSGELWV